MSKRPPLIAVYALIAVGYFGTIAIVAGGAIALFLKAREVLG